MEIDAGPEETGPEETTVTEQGMVTIPASIRRHFDIEAGDTVRWEIENGGLSVAIRTERYGAFDGFEPVPMGGGGTDSHDVAGHETDSRTEEDTE